MPEPTYKLSENTMNTFFTADLAGHVAKECVQRFLGTEFEGGRHVKRVEKL